jgi:hypothetical protein
MDRGRIMKIFKFGVPILLNEVIKNTATKVNRVIEKQARKIHPNLGQTVRKFNETIENVHITLNNAFDANDPINATVRALSNTKDISLGDHLYVQRVGFTHHGVFIGNNSVVHYLWKEGVKIDSLEKFAQGARIHKKNSTKIYSNAEIIVRARSRVREKNYNLFGNNCESFVIWCRSGRLY